MSIKTGIILCAGLGKRLNPLTLDKPKPLLKVNNLTLLENTINFVQELDLKKIFVNTFYLKDQIRDYLNFKKFNISLDIIEDGENLLDTGGGIKNIINFSDEKNFFIFNPDTVWNLNYLECVKKMEVFFEYNKVKNVLLVANKKLSFDKKLKGDFNLNSKNTLNYEEKNFIYTGCQIINKNVFSKINKKSFSIVEIWSQLINENKLYGFESFNNFIHVTDIEIFSKLSKN